MSEELKAMIRAMIEAGGKPDTEDQRAWLNKDVALAVQALQAEIARLTRERDEAREKALDEAETAVHNALIVLAMPGADTRPENAYSKAILAIRNLKEQP